MGIEDLTQLEILYRTFTLIFVVISLILGIKILSKFFIHKRKELITVGFSWIFLTSPWWGVAVSFLLYILFDYIIENIIFLILANVFVPVALICWIYSFCQLVYPQLKKNLMSIYLVICIPYEIFLIFFIFTHPDIVGTFERTFYLQPNIYTLIFQAFAILTALITGILFTKQSLRSDDKKVRWKGKFLSIAFISFTVSALLDAIIPANPIVLVLMRLILISSAIEYYFGFFLPDRFI